MQREAKPFNGQHKLYNTGFLFCVFWVLLSALYFPAARAGFVTDFTGWLDQIQNHSFSEYVNRTNFKARSMYQFTQLVTYFFYQLFGVNAWLWHLLFITLHAINAILLYKLSRLLLEDVGVENGVTVAFAGGILFCMSPYMSETLVWEPAFHFIQGTLFILLILTWAQRFVHTGKKKYALLASAVFLLSLFSLEVFYTTPWLVFMLGIFYSFHPVYGKGIFKKIGGFFFLPMLSLFVVRLVGYRLVYGDWVSRIGSDIVTQVQIDSFGKPAKYVFHLVFMGRFFPHNIKEKVYAICDSAAGIAAFYGIAVIIGIYIAVRFRRMGGKAKVASLFFTWTLITMALLIPLWFYDLLYVVMDRYVYLTSSFFYMLLAILVSFIAMKYVRIGIIAGFILVNLRYAIKMNRYWGKSYRVDNGLLYNLPEPGDKVLLLLNIPESMNGIPMIGSNDESEYKLMRNLLVPDKKINNTVYDVLSYNMLTPDDGGHVNVINDSTVRVTLNQWGTWWWYAGKGGHSYENNDYKLNLIDGGHLYELTLKKPASAYLLLYQVGDKWKVVDMNKKEADQN